MNNNTPLSTTSSTSTSIPIAKQSATFSTSASSNSFSKASVSSRAPPPSPIQRTSPQQQQQQPSSQQSTPLFPPSTSTTTTTTTKQFPINAPKATLSSLSTTLGTFGSLRTQQLAIFAHHLKLQQEEANIDNDRSNPLDPTADDAFAERIPRAFSERGDALRELHQAIDVFSKNMMEISNKNIQDTFKETINARKIEPIETIIMPVTEKEIQKNRKISAKTISSTSTTSTMNKANSIHKTPTE